MDERKYIFIKRKVLNLTGVDLNCYKTPQVQRRLKTYLVRSGHPNWHTFFRDMEKFEYLQNSILPGLLRGRPKLNMWSAGCSHGHEAYTLAIILAESTGFYRQHYILATDIDRSALDRAEAGGPYTDEEVSKAPTHLINRYFNHRTGGDAKKDGHYVIESLRRKLTFRYQNLLADDPFESAFDLIVCRNMVIYFTAEVKNRLYQRFYQALRPGGMLFVGGTEIVSKSSDLGFETAGISFYRRKE